MTTFAQLLIEGFAVVAIAALLTGLLALTCAVALDPVHPFGEAGVDATTRFFTPANQRKSHENNHRANERPTRFPPASHDLAPTHGNHHQSAGQDYLELDLQDLLDHLRNPHPSSSNG